MERSLLRLRRAEVAEEARIAAARLIDVERRLHLIEKENAMAQMEIIEKPLPAIRLAARSTVVAEQPEVPGVVGPLFDTVAALLAPAGMPAGVPVAEYGMGEDGLRITAGFAHTGPVPDGAETVELPAVPEAVCGVHLGSMEHIGESWQAVHAEIIARGLTLSGPCREVYLRSESEDQADWVTELQQPVTRA